MDLESFEDDIFPLFFLQIFLNRYIKFGNGRSIIIPSLTFLNNLSDFFLNDAKALFWKALAPAGNISLFSDFGIPKSI